MRKTDLKEYSESEVMKNVHASSEYREYQRNLCFGYNYGGDEL